MANARRRHREGARRGGGVGAPAVSTPLDMLPPVEVVDTLPAEALPAVIAHLAALQARVAARLATGIPTNGGGGDRMVGIEDAAARTGMSKSWLYRHHHALPFAKRIGRKVVFSEAGLTRWL